MPERIQRKRVKGWKMPPGTIYVGRPTRWGNHFEVGPGCTAEEAAALFRRSAEATFAVSPEYRESLEALRGKDLACWCKIGQPCHADVLLDLANR